MDKRTDTHTALLIEAAINASASHGATDAAAELCELGLRQETIDRVLYRPLERRQRWHQIDSMPCLPAMLPS